MKFLKFDDIAKYLLCNKCDLDKGSLKCSKCKTELREMKE